MLHHLSFAVSDIQRAGRFYDGVLASLGYVRVWTDENAIGYGMPNGGDRFAIKACEEAFTVPPEGFHVAFSAPSRDAVDVFYKKALELGGIDNGGSGLHPEYGPDYYAAFVIDTDGYRIEAVINK